MTIHVTVNRLVDVHDGTILQSRSHAIGSVKSCDSVFSVTTFTRSEASSSALS